MSLDPRGRHTAGVASALLVTACLASVAWPLATYTLTLAALGLAHVVSELRYVDLRFGAGLRRSLARTMGVVLIGIVVVRSASIAGVIDGRAAIVTELGLGLSLAALVLPTLWRRRPWTGLVGATIASALATAIIVAPAAGLLAIAIIHNFTPVGFILEATTGTNRRRAAMLCALVFVAVPGLIATGAVWRAVASLGVAAPEASPLGYGPLQEAMTAYLPKALLDPATALHLFAACVFLQCAHYVAVIVVLPALLHPQARGRLRWPARRWWPLVLAAMPLAIIPFAIDFTQARRGYGVLAAVHAWIELPILLLALLGTQSSKNKP